MADDPRDAPIFWKLSEELPNPKQRLFYEAKGRHIAYGGARGGGKAEPLDEPVLTPFGFRPMGSLKVGSQVCNPDGSVSRVIQVHPQGILPIYRITLLDGASTRVTAEHLWLVDKTQSDSRRSVMNTAAIANQIRRNSKTNLLIPLCEPVKFTRARDCGIIKPYTLGALLGDGCLVSQGNIRFTSADKEIVDRIRKDGYDPQPIPSRQKEGRTPEYSIHGFGACRKELNRLGLLVKSAEKFIPDSYKYAGLDDRISIMQGLMDTDGYADSRGHCFYTSVSKQLAEDVQWIVRSLGGKATITSKQGAYKKNRKRVACKTAYTVYINTKNNKQLFNLTRKKERCNEWFNGGASELKRRIVSVEPCGEAECQCITVDNPNGLYITRDFIVTHNSHAARRKCEMLAMRYNGIKILLLRRTFPELNENHILPMRSELYGYAKYNADERAFTLPNNSRIKLGYCDSDADVFQYQGQEYDVIFLEEATQFTEFQMNFLKTCNRTTRSDFTPRMYYTANPGGPGHAYIKRLFIDRKYVNGENPDDYVFIQANVYDNEVLMKSDPEYINALKSLPVEMRKAHLEGRWDVFLGQYFTEFDPKIHVVKPFAIPLHWRRYFTMDYGLDMLAGYWIAIDEHGRAYVYRELYKSQLRVGRAAEEIKRAETEDTISERFAPPDLFSRSSQTGRSTIEMMGDNGLFFTRTKNDRVQGWYDLAEWLALYLDEKDETVANLRIFETCSELIRCLPALQRNTKGDPNDVSDDDHELTHGPDAIRYFVTGRPRATEIVREVRRQHWEPDMYEDYERANEQDKAKLIERWGTPDYMM